jgi:hypothetical protein
VKNPSRWQRSTASEYGAGRRRARRQVQRFTPRRIIRWRGKGSSPTQIRKGTHRGERARTPPDQKVTGRPLALLPEGSPCRQARNRTARWVSLTSTSPCGRGPYARPAPGRADRGTATVTRLPLRTRAWNFCPPNTSSKCARRPAPTRISGPTTRLSGSVSAPGKSPSERVEQVSRTPRGRCPSATPSIVNAARRGSASLVAVDRSESSQPGNTASATSTARPATAARRLRIPPLHRRGPGGSTLSDRSPRADQHVIGLSRVRRP